MDWIIGLTGSLLIGGAAYRKKSLTLSGVVGAVLLGTTMFALGSIEWYGVLIAFFVSSTKLTKYKKRRKSAAESGYAKSGNRDIAQVAANGGIGLVLCVLNAVWPNQLWYIAFVGVMAAATADTWATEIGGLSRSLPRSILNGRKVTPGTSGGVTSLGTAASALGGLFIGLVAWICMQFVSDIDTSLVITLIVGLVGGLTGSLTDSWIGAVWQVMYRCTVCNKDVERTSHCDQPTVKVRGAQWLNNDAVNIIASILGGLAALGVFLVI
jgi:uncharacterized protein (TIGR00297 family)